MSDDLLRRMEKRVRRFGGPMAIDDLLPELDAESGVSSSGRASRETRESGSRSIDRNID